MSSVTHFEKNIKWGPNYLENFLDDNMKAIADLIVVKKGLDGDVKAIKQMIDKGEMLCKKEEKWTPEIESLITRELERST